MYIQLYSSVGYSVGTTWGYLDGTFYLIDVFRKRMDFPDLKRAVIEAYRKHSPHKLVIEDKASGTSLLQELMREGLYGIEPYKPQPGSDKYMRFPVAPRSTISAQRVFDRRLHQGVDTVRSAFLRFHFELNRNCRNCDQRIGPKMTPLQSSGESSAVPVREKIYSIARKSTESSNRDAKLFIINDLMAERGGFQSASPKKSLQQW